LQSGVTTHEKYTGSFMNQLCGMGGFHPVINNIVAFERYFVFLEHAMHSGRIVVISYVIHWPCAHKDKTVTVRQFFVKPLCYIMRKAVAGKAAEKTEKAIIHAHYPCSQTTF
jgi:hypothetical protein